MTLWERHYTGGCLLIVFFALSIRGYIIKSSLVFFRLTWNRNVLRDGISFRYIMNKFSLEYPFETCIGWGVHLFNQSTAVSNQCLHSNGNLTYTSSVNAHNAYLWPLWARQIWRQNSGMGKGLTCYVKAMYSVKYICSLLPQLNGSR